LADVERLAHDAERLARARDDALAKLESLQHFEHGAAHAQANTDVRPLRAELDIATTEAPHPRDALGHLEPPPATQPPTAAGGIDMPHRLLARAAAVSGIVVVIAIVIAIVVLR
jgi:hypothetical protein